MCSKEPSHRDGSFEYPQYMFWIRNKENSFPIHTLIWRPGGILTNEEFSGRMRVNIESNVDP